MNRLAQLPKAELYAYILILTRSDPKSFWESFKVIKKLEFRFLEHNSSEIFWDQIFTQCDRIYNSYLRNFKNQTSPFSHFCVKRNLENSDFQAFKTPSGPLNHYDGVSIHNQNAFQRQIKLSALGKIRKYL